MKTNQVNQTKTYQAEKSTFWVIKSGVDAGKPFLYPIEDAYKIDVVDRKLFLHLYWLSYGLHLSGTFRNELLVDAVYLLPESTYKQILGLAHQEWMGKPALYEKMLDALMCRRTDTKTAEEYKAQIAAMPGTFKQMLKRNTWKHF